MNDYCKQLFEDNSVNINQCAATDEEEGEQDQGDDEYYWYSYDMEDADDAEKVCAKIVSFNGEYSNHYDSAISGTVHTRDRNGNLATSESTNFWTTWNTPDLSVGAIAAIVVASVVVVVGFAARLLSSKKETASLHEPMYRGGRIS